MATNIRLVDARASEGIMDGQKGGPMHRLWDLAISMARYGVAGGAGVVAHVCVLHVLVQYAGVDPVPASAAGFACALPVNFLIQQHYVFRISDYPLRRAMRYLTVTAFAGVLNVILYWIVTDIAGIQYLIGQLFVIGVIAVVNFAGNKIYTFGAMHAPTPAAFETVSR